jgi:hypothetical protein
MRFSLEFETHQPFDSRELFGAPAMEGRGSQVKLSTSIQSEHWVAFADALARVLEESAEGE